jgi:hypothetical protein
MGGWFLFMAMMGGGSAAGGGVGTPILVSGILCSRIILGEASR